MDRDRFWQIIDRTRSAERTEREQSLRAELSRLSGDDLVGFDQVWGELLRETYRWDLWGAAYVLAGGCSDDAFEDFRNWLILHGRDAFERVTKDPDGLGAVASGADDIFWEGARGIAAAVYRDLTGRAMESRPLGYPVEPAGEPWDELDAAGLRRRYPRTSAATSSGGAP